MDEVYALWFFYSFQIPRLGKEFDLLQIREDQIVNVELKSGAVSDEALRKQLIQNRYYLAVQGKTIRSYTYISSQNRLPDCPAAGYRTPDLKENLGGADRGVLVYGTSGDGKDAAALRYRYEAFREAEGLHDPLRGEQEGLEAAS